MRVFASLATIVLASAVSGQTIPSLASLNTGVDAEGRVWGKATVRAPDGRELTVLRRPFSGEERSGPASELRPVRRLYRDAAGRTRVERLLTQGASPLDGPQLIELNDPNEGVLYILDVGRKTAHRMRYPPSSRLNMQPIIGPGHAPAVNGVTPSVTEENLGSKTVEGIPADGQRFTTVIPSQPAGGDSITRIEEIWTSPGLWLTLRQTIRDPRDGDTAFELININLDEPAPELFQPPSGYRIVSTPSPLNLEFGAAPQPGPLTPQPAPTRPRADPYSPRSGPITPRSAPPAGRPGSDRPETGQDGVYTPGNGVSRPVRISGPQPGYSEAARKGLISGSVLAELIVGVDGIPRDIRIVRSLEPGLDQNAIEALSQWRFRPGQLDGKPVPVRARIEITFGVRRPPGFPPAAAGPPTAGPRGQDFPRTSRPQ